MPRTLLLCFIHGFKGSENTFQSFPDDLKWRAQKRLAENGNGDHVEAVVYPTYETKGELSQSTERLLEWLREQVMNLRKAKTEKPWPPNDRDVGVVLVAHSMGGFVAADALFATLNDKIKNDKAEDTESSPSSSSSSPKTLFPLIQGLLAFDTPYNGLARSMFVYGAFSNYQKVSSVFNVMTALSAAAPAQLSKLSLNRRSTVPVAPSSSSSSTAWKSWQLLAVRTGTVGAIAAGGVAAYMHREEIMEGMRSMRNLNRDSMKEGYQQSVDSLGQGLAYINRGNVGKSFEWLSDHFTFVGSLMKQQELNRRLERMGLLKGVGIHDFYASLGENGVWSGGYFIPERTFCAVPPDGHPACHLFSRFVIKAEDEVQAHVSMFKRDRNEFYDQMLDQASNLAIQWFNDNSEAVDDPKFVEEVLSAATADNQEQGQEKDGLEPQVTTMTDDGHEVPKVDEAILGEKDERKKDVKDSSTEGRDDGVPDESPLDIAAAASMVALPDDDVEAPDLVSASEQKDSTYMRYLFGVAQQAGSGFKSYVPRTMPDMPQMPSMPSMPAMPSGPSFKSYIPTGLPNLPSVNVFTSKKAKANPPDAQTSETGENAQEGARDHDKLSRSEMPVVERQT